MRPVLAAALAAPFVLASGAAQAADTQLSCSGEARLMPQESSSPVDVKLTVAGGLEAPSAITYAWALPDGPVPMTLQSLTGDTLAFHGISQQDGAVLLADAHLNRTTLALVLKVRRVGGAGPADVTLESTCRRA